MSTDDPFVIAIRSNWLDRTTRLAYADWLEDRADPRAKLVRVCEGMRDVPVWSDRYWELKARRNELWTRVPLEWLEATGYDGSYYDPIFRDGVPDDPLARWRLIREFTERWHGIAAPDVGNRSDVVQKHARVLGLDLPPAVHEFLAFSFVLGGYGRSEYPHPRLFHYDAPELRHLPLNDALSLLRSTDGDGALGVARADLGESDPPVYRFFERWSDDVDYDEDGQPAPRVEDAIFADPSVSLAAFNRLLPELPVAGWLSEPDAGSDELLTQLRERFPIHSRFDDADVFEADEMLVVVSGPRSAYTAALTARAVYAVVRRPVSRATIPDCLLALAGGDGGAWGLFVSDDVRPDRVPAGYQRTSGWPPFWGSALSRQKPEAVIEEPDESAGGADPIPF